MLVSTQEVVSEARLRSQRRNQMLQLSYEVCHKSRANAAQEAIAHRRGKNVQYE
jgi:hypothetical protein